jgi:hypothetical protein
MYVYIYIYIYMNMQCLFNDSFSSYVYIFLKIGFSEWVDGNNIEKM